MSRVIARTSVFFILLIISVSAFTESPYSLTPSTSIASEGFLTLSWQTASVQTQSIPSVLRVSEDEQLASVGWTIPVPRQQQVHLSGFNDGVYYAQLFGPGDKPLSTIVTFEVQHRDLRWAITLFIVGLVTFLFLSVCLARFSINNREF